MSHIKKYKLFTRLFVCWVLVFLLPLLAYTFVFDPWQLFHKPWFREPLFIQNSRFQDAGLINNYDFDAAILGTSIAQNFSIVEASSLFKHSFINLSLEGALFSERAIVLKRVLQKKKLDLVILSMDFLPESAVGEYKESPAPDQFDFLYNSNRLDDFRIYMDWDLFKCWDLSNACPQLLPGKRIASLNTLYYWQGNTEDDIKKRGVAGWCSASDTPYTHGWLTEIIHVADGIKSGKFPAREVLDRKFKNNLAGTFDTYVVPYITRYPEVEFYLFFPPYSRLRYALLQQGYQSVYDLYCWYIEYVVNTMKELGNVKVFGFDDATFPDDLNHYRDVLHYDPGINSQMLHWMVEDKHVLTIDKLHEYLDKIRLSADSYDLLSVADKFRRCMEKE